VELNFPATLVAEGIAGEALVAESADPIDNPMRAPRLGLFHRLWQNALPSELGAILT